MNNNFSLFRYIPSDSKVHKMNSKNKIILFLLCIITSILIVDIKSIFLFLIFLIYIILKSNIKIENYIRNLLIFWPLYIVFYIISFIITFDILVSVLIVIKFVFIIISFLILTLTTSLSEIAWGLECLFSGLKSFKIPVSKISLKIAMEIKFISVLYDQYRQIKKSLAYRGLRNKNSLRFLFIPTFKLSYKLSKRTLTTMKLRFYGSSKKRTNYHQNKTSSFDKKLIILNGIILYICLWLGWI